MNKFLLYLMLLPKGLWARLGADVHQLKVILGVKLTLDDRRPMTLGKQQAKKKKESKNASVMGMVISGVVGFFYITSLFLDDVYMGLWVYFSLFLLMLSFMLVSDFSSVLFDTKDNTILLSRPINERTLLLARLLHMFIYLFRLVLPMSLAGWIAMGIMHGFLAVLWFPFAILMLTVVAMFLVNTCYLLVLFFSSPNRFKDIINYFQIVFSVLVFACIYLLPKAMDSEGFQQLKVIDFPWAKFTPSFWLAASWSWFDQVAPAKSFYWIGLLALVGPLFLMWLILKFLAPSFARKMAAIGVSNSEPIQKKAILEKNNSKTKLYERLAKTLNKSPYSKAGFNIAWLQTGRSRTFKMRVIPGYAYVFVYFIYIISQGNRSFSETLRHLDKGDSYILLLYITSFVVLQLMSQLVFSDQYKAAWVYYSSPVARPGSVMAGAFKAVWFKYFVPLFLVVSLLVIGIWGWQKVIDIILAFSNITLLALSVLLISYRRLPFSSLEQMTEKSNRFLKSMFMTLLPMSLGFLHYGLTKFAWLWWAKIVFLLLSFSVMLALWINYKNTDWEQLKKEDYA